MDCYYSFFQCYNIKWYQTRYLVVHTSSVRPAFKKKWPHKQSQCPDYFALHFAFILLYRIITQLRYCFQVKPHGGHQILTTKTFDRKHSTLTTYHHNNQHFAKWSVLWIVLTKYDLEVGFRFREKCKSFYCGQLNMANKRYFITYLNNTNVVQFIYFCSQFIISLTWLTLAFMRWVQNYSITNCS